MLLALLRACNDALTSPRPRQAEALTCLTFMLSGNLFGIHVSAIREIARCGILAVPRDKPNCLRGLYRYKGTMVPVIDLTKRYSTHATDIGWRTCIVIVELGQGRRCQPVGVLVDEVRGMAEFAPAQLKPLPQDITRILQVDIVEGLVKLATDCLIVLDIQRLLSDEEAVELRAYSV